MLGNPRDHDAEGVPPCFAEPLPVSDYVRVGRGAIPIGLPAAARRLIVKAISMEDRVTPACPRQPGRGRA